MYEPSDDTYLLIDAIGLDVDIMERKCDGEGGRNNTMKRSDVKTTLEIGCGTGVPSVYLAMRLRGLFDDDQQSTPADEQHNRDIQQCIHPMHHVTDINSGSGKRLMMTGKKQAALWYNKSESQPC